MKILYVTVLPSSMNFFVMHIRTLINNGYDVGLACNTDYGTINPIFEQMGCKIHTIHFKRSIKGLLDLTPQKELIDLLREEKYDIVNTNMPTSSFVTRLACKKLRKTGLKVVYTVHGFHFFKGSPFINWLIFYPMEKILSRYTDYIITINKEDYYLSTKKMHCKTFYIPGVGVDTNRFKNIKINKTNFLNQLGIKDDRYICLSIGELCPRKNHKTIIKAMKYVKTNTILLIAGEGYLKEKLTKLIKKEKLEDKVFLLGFRRDVEQLYGMADIFLLPSVREGLGLVSIEAMASSKPLITSNVNGIKDYMIDGVTGFMCNPQSKKSFANKIDFLLNNDSIYNSISKYNSIACESFNNDKSCKELLKIMNIVSGK